MKFKSITHLFLDLDHTLWDYDTNARNTLTEIYNQLNLSRFTFTAETFIQEFFEVNEQHWKAYNLGTINTSQLRNGRFQVVLKNLGHENGTLAFQIRDLFQKLGPQKSLLMSGTLEMLSWAKNTFEIHILTNGFEDSQHTKIKVSGIKPFIESVWTSERVGYKKPHPQFFKTVLNNLEIEPEMAVMVGDNPLADIHGAQSCGINAVLYDPSKNIRDPNIKYRISSWYEFPIFFE